MAHKILIIGPAWVGDMVMAQSLFKLLKAQTPDVVIDVVAPQWSLPLLARMPEVANSIIMPATHGELKLGARYQLAKTLRQAAYDSAIVLPNSFKSALIPFFARIPIRTGWLGEMRFGLLNDIRFNPKQYPLMVERFLALGSPAGTPLPAMYPIPQLSVTPTTQAVALKKHQLTTDRPVLVLAPGAEFGAAKRWPEAHFADIAQAKLQAGWQVWLLGSPKDTEVTAKIKTLTAGAAIDLAGKTTLEEAVDLLSAATLVVSNDSGLMHIASALHRPVVALYGPTSAGFTPPLSQGAKILSTALPCQPCFKRTCPLNHHRCMETLLPETVLKAMSELS